MPLQSSVRALKKPLRLDDEVRFLRSWIEKPLHMGAVMPSGKILARTMAQYVDIDSDGPVDLISTYCAMVRASTRPEGITAPM